MGVVVDVYFQQMIQLSRGSCVWILRIMAKFPVLMNDVIVVGV